MAEISDPAPVFLLISTGAILINISQVPLDAFALPVGSLYLTGSEGVFQAVQLILTALACVSALFFLSFNTPMTDILAVPGVLPPAPPSHRAYDAHLPVHFPPSGKRLLHASSQTPGLEIKICAQALNPVASWLHALHPRHEAGRLSLRRHGVPLLRRSDPGTARTSASPPGEILCIAAFELLLLLLALLPPQPQPVG